MAGDWITVEKATARKPEVLQLADILGVHPDHAFGLCVRFWMWCDDNLYSCHAPSVTFVTLDSVFGHAGFCAALVSVGWLAVRTDGIEIPNFDRHLSISAKTRALATIRKRNERERKVTEMSRAERDISVTTEQNTSELNCTELKKKKPRKTEMWPSGIEELRPLSEVAVAPLPLGKVNGSAVFDGVTAEWLRAPATVIGWFRRQLGAASPVLPANQAGALMALCCAARATEPGARNPVGAFASLVTKRKWDEVKRFHDSGIKQLKEAIENGNL